MNSVFWGQKSVKQSSMGALKEVMAEAQELSGVVIRSTGSWYEVRTVDGAVTSCTVKGKFKIAGIKSTNPIAVGDQVVFNMRDNENTGVIHSILPRQNYIIRKSTNLSKQTHIIAANIDFAFLVITINQPRTSAGFIDRFLLTAGAYHIPVVLVFNKTDLFGEAEENWAGEWISLYESLGYKTLKTSALNGNGLGNLKDLMQGHTSLFSGHSGVGKSALVNALQPEIQLKTTEISNFNQKGKHTTTFAEMHPLSFSGYIIDTPGIKEFGIVDLDQPDISGYFPEMKNLMHLCKYHNCLHLKEPHCAVKLAVENGIIAASRYNSYVSIVTGEDFDKKPM